MSLNRCSCKEKTDVEFLKADVINLTSFPQVFVGAERIKTLGSFADSLTDAAHKKTDNNRKTKKQKAYQKWVSSSNVPERLQGEKILFL